MQTDTHASLYTCAARYGLLLAGVLLFGATSAAQTEVSGTIVEDEWTVEGSPYMVVGDILIAGLEIGPGVEVLFTGDYDFEIAGVLSAVGTEQDSVRFAPADEAIGWQGLFFNFSSPGSELAFFTVEGATSSGIHIDNSAPILRDCRIANNTSTAEDTGGGLTTNAELVVTDCVIERNTAARFGAGVHSSGALTLIRTNVRDNVIDQTLSTQAIAGGGIYSTGDLTLLASVVEGNLARSVNGNPFQSATAMGGGIYSATGVLELRNSIVRSNRARAGANTAAEIALGGGAYVEGGSVQLTNSVISHNTLGTRLVWSGSAAQGGGIRIGSGSLDLQNATLAYNDFDGAWVAAGATADVANSILYFNAADEERDQEPAQIEGLATVAYSDVQHGWEGEGIIDLNPIFASDTVLVIVDGSPAVDQGDPAAAAADGCLPPGLGTAANDMGAHGGPGNCGWLGGFPVDADAGPEQHAALLTALAAYPNPSVAAVTIAFGLSQPAEVTLRVFDVLGREVGTVTQQLPAGEHRLPWRVAGLASGVYLYRVEVRMPSGTETRSGRLTLLE